jgi:hypothetical protein
VGVYTREKNAHVCLRSRDEGATNADWEDRSDQTRGTQKSSQ